MQKNSEKKAIPTAWDRKGTVSSRSARTIFSIPKKSSLREILEIDRAVLLTPETRTFLKELVHDLLRINNAVIYKNVGITEKQFNVIYYGNELGKNMPIDPLETVSSGDLKRILYFLYTMGWRQHKKLGERILAYEKILETLAHLFPEITHKFQYSKGVDVVAVEKLLDSIWYTFHLKKEDYLPSWEEVVFYDQIEFPIVMTPEETPISDEEFLDSNSRSLGMARLLGAIGILNELEFTSEKRQEDTPYLITSFFPHECGDESETRQKSMVSVFVTDQVSMVWEEMLERKKETTHLHFSKVNDELYGIFVSF